jgi:hypothetical protein
MSVLTLEGVVEAGKIRLLSDEQLPEKTMVYVVIPDYKPTITSYSVTLPDHPRLLSPHLVRKEDTPHFAVEMREDNHDQL